MLHKNFGQRYANLVLVKFMLLNYHFHMVYLLVIS